MLHPQIAIYTRRLAVMFVSLAFAVTGWHVRADHLERAFRTPPPEARPWVYWFWLNSNVTSNGITADLEAMKRVGIGGVLIMEVDQGTPKGQAAFAGPLWRDLFKHVCVEADRLGLEVNMNNDAGWCGSGGPWITPELAMQKLVWTETPIEGPRQFAGTLPQPQKVADYYRDIAVFAYPTPAGDTRTEDIAGKSSLIPQRLPVRASWPAVAADQVVARDRILNLTAQFGADGKLAWDVPAGKWTILRLGHTLTGKDNHPAPESGRGLESDKLSTQATDVMFAGLMGKIIADSKLCVGRTLVATHIDSWETGSQNWTPKFREEFQKRRGYDPLPFLPAITGRVVDSAEITERFLWDWRQTVSDLIIGNYAGRFRALAHQHGLRLSIEAYDGVPCDEMTYAGQADEPMAEFWSWGYSTPYSCTEMASAAHTYGKRILGAEAFTASDSEKWLGHPAVVKALGDWAFCEGINRFVFHRYALQPWRGAAPGMSMGPWGLHYERTQTWWEQSAAWHDYLARCQWLLRQGLFVADVCFLQPEGAPIRFAPTIPGRVGNTPDRPGYNFDGCTPEVLLTRMKAKNDRLVLPDGMSYRVLVLPQVETMTPALLRKVKELVQVGATVIGPPPARSPSLVGYPRCDDEVKQLAKEIWGEFALPAAAGSTLKPTEGGTPNDGRHFGKGRVIWNAGFETPLAKPDAKSPIESAKWIWHKEGNPAVAAPPGRRCFRRVVTLDAARTVASARLALTVDNSFEVWINGQRVGAGDDFNQLFLFDVARFLKPGANLIAVAAVNGADNPNPAALIGALQIRFTDTSALEIPTDKSWGSARSAAENWILNATISEGWGAALELGPPGMQPWGVPGRTAPAQYVYPDFSAITNLLAGLGVPPDFEADGTLRYIHRRDGDTDIYFVANPGTNWLGATCAFRVTGKTPEVWNPLTGETTRSVVYTEESGRIRVPLWFEPSGSRFVVFRTASLAKSAVVVAVRRNGKGVLPGLAAPLPGPPPVELSAGRGRAMQALAWQAGRYELKTASGQTRQFEIAPLPPPLEVRGPWEVQFQPQRGAPDQLTFDDLTDWSQHRDPGVKYFSGRATYRTTFVLNPESDAGNLRWYLDLGQVAVIADVKLNGRALGTLWKPPYHVDVTGALKSGANSLEVQVANLWVNRQIGDEQLPEDSDRNPNGTLRQWPAWVQEDKPSPSGRVSFTSWRLWKKGDPLVESGLLGPVRLVPAVEKTLQASGDCRI